MAKILGIIAALVFIGFIIWALFGGNFSRSDSNSNINTNNTNNMNNPVVVMKTNLGEIKIELLADQAPKTVDNFLKLTRAGFYDGTLFHRVIKNFMIQGGDPLTKSEPENLAIHGQGGPGYQFADEFNEIKLVRGILAMANAGPGTNGSQFFIVTAPLVDWLNTRKPGVGWHTPFGRVLEGMEVMTKIENVKVTSDQERPAAHPLENVTLEKVEILN